MNTKREIPPRIIAAVVVAIVLVIGIMAFRTFGGDPNASNISPAQIKQMQAEKGQIMGAKRDATGHPIAGTAGANTQKAGQ